jgi:rhamnopyranosyl-N-acetylglucosaminyl-diphospho-decaprenol beta-1,3/1,4-galactofuranosyltransferase
MDDDGSPAPDCLQQLVGIDHPNLWYRAPLVLDEENHELLAFALRPPDGNSLLTTRVETVAAATDGLIAGTACPFNGVLIHHRVFETIGFPLRQMFMWGDESEFTLRAHRAGFVATTCVRAVHFHPRDRMKSRTFHFLGRTLGVAHVGNPLRDYLIVRNQAYISRVYYGWWRALKHTGRYTVFYLMEYGVAAALRACRSGVAGMFGTLTGHKKFLTKKA